MADPTYQMLWRCTQCQTPDLLALTQRFCPNCGTAQDPDQRYFPPEGQETPVDNHIYVGVDWRCQYCEAPNSAKATHCTHCGGPKEGAAPVALVADGENSARPPGPAKPEAKGNSAPQSSNVPLNPPQPTPILNTKQAATSGQADSPTLRSLGWVVYTALALLLVVLGWVGWQGASWVVRYFSVHTETVAVVDQTWQRSIDLEQYVAQSESAWCDSMPSGAYNVIRFREQRSTREVADGETCHTVRSDQGDGTFTTRRECETRWRSEPVYDDRCRYRINRWSVVHTARTSGTSLHNPEWPSLSVNTPWAPGSTPTLGAQRPGTQSEAYQVMLKGSATTPWTCSVPHQAGWQTMKPGTQLQLNVRGTGSAICDSLALRSTP